MTDLPTALKRKDAEIAELERIIADITRQLNDAKIGASDLGRPGSTWWNSATFAVDKKKVQLKRLVKEREQLIINADRVRSAKPDRPTAQKRIQTLLKLAHSVSSFMDNDSDEAYDAMGSLVAELSAVWPDWQAVSLEQP
jgi:hypothetical protein